MNLDNTLIEIDSLDLTFPSNNGHPIEVFTNFSLRVEEGEFVAIVGPSGCGKTSLLKLIGDLLQPTEGSIYIDGHSPREARKNRDFSFVFQNPVLFPWRTVRQNVELAGELFRDRAVRAQAEAFIKLVGLEEFGDAYPDQLSGGMRSRVAIARALTFQPKVLLMDEPFGALDDMTRLEMNNLLIKVLESFPLATTILVTHSIDEAIYLSDRVVVLSERPAAIEDQIPITLPRPRDLATRDHPHFLTIRRGIERLLFGREEYEGYYRTKPESPENQA